MGAGLGIAAGKYLESEEGKIKKEKMKKMFSDFCSFAGSKMKMIKNLNKAKYKQVITSAAEEYGKMKKISEESIQELVNRTMELWDDFLENKEV